MHSIKYSLLKDVYLNAYLDGNISEIGRRHFKLRLGVYARSTEIDPDRQAIFNELGSDRVRRFLLHKPRICAIDLTIYNICMIIFKFC